MTIVEPWTSEIWGCCCDCIMSVFPVLLSASGRAGVGDGDGWKKPPSEVPLLWLSLVLIVDGTGEKGFVLVTVLARCSKFWF